MTITHLMLSGCADGLPSKVAEVDRECLEKRSQHMQTTIPEGNRQHTAAGLFTDAALIGAAWPFNVTTDLGPELARAVHVWQVGTEEFAVIFSLVSCLGLCLGAEGLVYERCAQRCSVAL